MKFAYIDESGNNGGDGDVFSMVAVSIDSYRLRKYTSEFDKLLKGLKLDSEINFKEFKTSDFINGKRGWSKLDSSIRKNFLKQVVDLCVDSSKLYVYVMSFEKFNSINQPFKRVSYWLSCALYVCSIIQKKGQKEKNNKGLSLVVFDENHKEMPKLSDFLYRQDGAFDDLYAEKRIIRKKACWDVKPEKRFDHIINTAFAIKSEHSSFVQVADALAYIYRRHFELEDLEEVWEGEKDFYSSLHNKLESIRMKVGATPPKSKCVDYYKSIKHNKFKL